MEFCSFVLVGVAIGSDRSVDMVWVVVSSAL